MNDSKKLIHIRITEQEKLRMETIAKKCGLSLSEYLRKRGLEYEPKTLCDDTALAFYSKLCEISNFPLTPETDSLLEVLLRDLQRALFKPHKQTQSEIIKEVVTSQRQDSCLYLFYGS